MSEKNATERCTLRKWVNPATHTVLQSKNCWRPFLSRFRGPSDSPNKSSVVALLNPFGSELARMVTIIRWQLVTLCILYIGEQGTFTKLDLIPVRCTTPVAKKVRQFCCQLYQKILSFFATYVIT